MTRRIPNATRFHPTYDMLADKQIKRGAHRSVKVLIADIMNFIAKRNNDPTPLRWTKSADDILASIERYCQRTLDGQANAKEGA